jgi:Tripartite tricarboxylate transporter TctA family
VTRTPSVVSMTTQGQAGSRSWLDDGAIRSASDIALGVALIAAGTLVIANGGGTSFSRLDQLDGWFFPTAVAGLLVLVGVVLLLRGGFPRSAQPASWSPVELLIIVSTIGAAVLAAWRWGDGLALQFGPAEYAALSVFELAVAIALARMSRARAVGMALLGLLLATVGADLATGTPRLTMGLVQLADGIALPILALGLIVVADGVSCLVSPAWYWATYARLVKGWTAPPIPTTAGLGMRLVAALAIAAACYLVFLLNNSQWDVGELLVFGAFGVACKVFGWNRLVLILAFANAPLLEENIRRAMLISRGDPTTFLLRPFSGTLLLAACGLLAIVALMSARRALLQGRSPT